MAAKIKILSLLSFMALLFIPASSWAAADPGTGASGKNTSKPANCTKATNIRDNCITKDINVIVNFLSIGVGVIIIGMLILGGIQYSLAGDKPEAVNAAKQRIINALIALVAYIFIFAFVQWLVPGGVF